MHLYLLAIIYLVFSLLERMFISYDSKFFFLLGLFIAGLVIKERGHLHQGVDKLKEIFSKSKIN